MLAGIEEVPAESVAVKLIGYEPATVGIPLMVLLVIVSPAGSPVAV